MKLNSCYRSQKKATWTRNDQSSVIDLTFISSSLSGRMILCGRADDIEHSSDHFPIRTTLDIETPILTQQKRRNWKATDDRSLIQKIEEGLQERDLSMEHHRQIEEQCQKLLDVVQCAIDLSTPWAKPSTWSNPDFDEECRAAEDESTNEALGRIYQPRRPWNTGLTCGKQRRLF